MKGSARSSTQQDTILLSEVPNAESLIGSTQLGTGGKATQPPEQSSAQASANFHLSGAAAAALGQRYDILSDAGQGSMGNVFKARDRETGETVALKLLKPEIASDQAMMERFKNELLFARKITHKNVCRVHDFNRIGGVAYTSMEFVEGESLRSVLNRFGGLPVRKAIDLTRQICSGLKEAHAQGIVHRDLKPENVMVDARGNVKIMDFGIARSMDALTRMTGAMVGTPAYMAPEQVGGKPVDYRTDIYSLGLILYEIFTGAQAFHAENAVAVAMKQLHDAPTPPHEVDPGIPVAIERAILKCLEKEPAKRFQSVDELEKALLPAAAQAGGMPVSSTTAGRSTQDVLAQYPTPVPTPRPFAPPPTRKSSAGKWIILTLLLVLALVAAGAKRAQLMKLAAEKHLIAAVTPPGPPDIALQTSNQSASQPNADGASAAAAPASTPAPAASAGSPTPASIANSQAPVPDQASTPSTPPPTASAPSSRPAATTPAASAPAAAVVAPQAPMAVPPPATPSSRPNTSPRANGTPPGRSNAQNPQNPQNPSADVQQRADSAFKEQASAPSEPADEPNPPLGSVLRGKGPSYIWVGRYEREDRAQDASRKIQGLGLPSVVVPRRGPEGQGYIVFTGPFTPDRLPSVIDWLKTQGFPFVREVKAMTASQRGGGPPNPDSDPGAGAP